MSYSHILTGESLSPARPVVRRITPSDLYQALSRGVDDFMAMPSHAVFLCAIYPILGLFLIAITLDNSLLPLAFPIAAGFALVGPVAAIGLYELSRRREAGLETTSMHADDFQFARPAFGDALNRVVDQSARQPVQRRLRIVLANRDDDSVLLLDRNAGWQLRIQLALRPLHRDGVAFDFYRHPFGDRDRLFSNS